MTDSVKSWSENEAQAVLKRLRKTKRPARQNMSTKQVLYMLYMPTVLKWRDEGWRYDEIVTALNEHGIPIARSTLYSYVRDFRQQHAKNKAAPASTNEDVSNDGAVKPTTTRRTLPKVDYSTNAKPVVTQPVSGDTASTKKKTLVDVLNEDV